MNVHKLERWHAIAMLVGAVLLILISYEKFKGGKL